LRNHLGPPPSARRSSASTPRRIPTGRFIVQISRRVLEGRPDDIALVQDQRPAQAALAHLRLVDDAQIARPTLLALAIIFRILFRRAPSPELASPIDQNRSERFVFAGKLRMADCEVVLRAATDRSDTLTVPLTTCRLIGMRNHDPDQDGRSTAAQGIRAVSGSTRFLGWTLRGWVAALVCAVGHRDPNPGAVR
jgi:hypothetical protein